MTGKDDFTENMNALKEIASNIKDPDVPLEDAIKDFEKGMEHYKKCDAILKDAEQKIEVLKKGME